jgi:hypothetical protein
MTQWFFTCSFASSNEQTLGQEIGDSATFHFNLGSMRRFFEMDYEAIN